MRFSQLKAFHAVAVWGGFSKAAHKLQISQPAVSDHIRNLEEMYGVQLFIRSSKSVTLTQVGRKLFVLAENMVEIEQAARELLLRASELKEGHITIGADAAVHILPVLSTFRSLYPKIKLTVTTGNSKKLLERLERFEIDFAVVAAEPNSQTIESRLLSQNSLVAICAKDDKFAQIKTIKLKQLQNTPLILREKGSATRQIFDRACSNSNISPSNIIEVEGREAVREAVAVGLGVGIVSKAEFVDDARLKIVEISDMQEQMNEWLVCLKSRTNLHMISALLDIVE